MDEGENPTAAKRNPPTCPKYKRRTSGRPVSPLKESSTRTGTRRSAARERASRPPDGSELKV